MRFFPKLKNLILSSKLILYSKSFFFFNYLFQLQASINLLTPSTLETVNIATVHNGFLSRVSSATCVQLERKMVCIKKGTFFTKPAESNYASVFVICVSTITQNQE